jgi:DNA-binding response OmpR family regulator
VPAVPRVLVVEDEASIAMMLRDWLAELGCEAVGPVNTVQDALTLIDDEALDAAILDVALGEQDCYPIADALRDRGVPFAFATGRAGDNLAVRHADAPTLLKPFDFEAASGIVAKLLKHAIT